MDEVTLTEYVNARCGEVYLSNQGTLIFLCSLCNESFKGYGMYLEHILEAHDLPVYCVEELDENIEQQNELCDEIEEMDSVEILEDDNVLIELKDELEELDAHFDPNLDLDTKHSIESFDSNFENQYANFIRREQKSFKEHDVPVKVKVEQLSHTDEITPNFKNIKKRKERQEYPSQGIFECPVCQLSIKGKSNLEKHILRHDDDNKRFQCAYCPKRFHVKFEQRQHEASHTGDRPYLCTICGRRFVSTGKLNEHTNMTHKNIRNKSCEICGKMFYSDKYLRRHMMTHSNERCHKCEICSAAFKIRKTLIAHMKLHENKREYQCKYCDAQFNQRPALHSHMKTRHKSLLKTDEKTEDTNFF